MFFFKIFMMFCTLLLTSSAALAASDNNELFDEMKLSTVWKTKLIQGYKVSFNIMKSPPYMKHERSHRIFIKIEKNNQLINLQLVRLKISQQDEPTMIQPMVKIGDWYMLSYNLDELNKQQLVVLFQTSDNQTHYGGVLYPK